jgi:hypothetical protein
MTGTIRFVLVAGAAAFGVASLIHGGVLLQGWEHVRAATAEGVIGAVLGLGLVATLMWPAAARRIALGVEGFALLGTLVGAFTIAVGIGPRTGPDIVFHALLLIGLVAALMTTWRNRRGSPVPRRRSRPRL